MRENMGLYRGKRKDNGEWIEGFLVVIGKLYYILTGKVDITKGVALERFEVIPSTVGQFTGLSDKTGKRIFEGDICRNTKTGEIVSVKWHGTMAGYVWSKPKNDNKHLYDFGELFRVYDKYEVIGNIHDNPELLEVSNNENNQPHRGPVL